jgi:predicted Zn-ribbon and HTH transcriptional regulator
MFIIVFGGIMGNEDIVTLAVVGLIALSVLVSELVVKPAKCPRCGRSYPLQESYTKDCQVCLDEWRAKEFEL